MCYPNNTGKWSRTKGTAVSYGLSEVSQHLLVSQILFRNMWDDVQISDLCDQNNNLADWSLAMSQIVPTGNDPEGSGHVQIL